MVAARENIGVGLMGLGVIGSGVVSVLTGKSDKLASESNRPLILKKILEKDVSKHGSMGLSKGIFTSDFEEFLNNPEIEIVIELIGGENPAFDFIKRCITAGKHVVTANKEVMAKHGYEILQLARDNHVDVRYEASVGGGIPVISPFIDDLMVNDIKAILGIVNGTTNYILTSMAQEGLDFGIALAQAQKLGYAEANPENDIGGADAAYKLAILATIAFGIEVKIADVYYEGISKLEANDFRYSRELGYAIKLLAIAKQTDGFIEVRVHPVFIPEDALLAKVDGVFNAVEIEGDLVGKLIFYGRGAGAAPTSSAVMADVVNIAGNISQGIKSIPKIASGKAYQIKPMPEVETRGYIRMRILDQSGVLAQISKVLGDNEISIASVIQKETDLSSNTAEIVIMTHPSKEDAIQKALTDMRRVAAVKEINNYIRVED
jgi:homoserine dehydrogenase